MIYLFDLDGTIIDISIYKAIYPKIKEMLESKGFNLEQEAIRLDLELKQEGRYDSGEVCKGLDLLEQYYQILKEQIAKQEIANSSIVNQMQQVKEQNHVVAIVSNSMRNTIQLYVDTLSLDVDFIFSSEDANHKKIDVEFWQELIKRHDLTPQECIVIGDNIVDDHEIPRELGFRTQLLH